MAQEGAPHKITVNAYAPGMTDTTLMDEIDEQFGDMTGQAKGEMKRNYADGTPEDVAGLVGGYLASADSDYATGQTMIVDGGGVYFT